MLSKTLNCDNSLIKFWQSSIDSPPQNCLKNNFFIIELIGILKKIAICKQTFPILTNVGLLSSLNK